jgi:hypothetical protein
MGCEPVLNLAATPDEAVSFIYTIVDKTILLTFGGKLMYVSYTTDWPVSVGHPTGALAIICCWVLLICLTYAYGMLCQDDIVPGEFFLLQCACQFFWTGHINPCKFMINYDCYIIKRHVSHAWYGCWTIKALVEAEVL